MNDFKRFMFLSSIIRKEMLFSNRTKIMIPILFLFIPGFAWGFADQDVVLPGNIQPDSAMEILFYTSIGILFSATIFAVLQAHDGISKDRISGVLEVRLSQPFNRTKQTSALILVIGRVALFPYSFVLFSLLSPWLFGGVSALHSLNFQSSFLPSPYWFCGIHYSPLSLHHLLMNKAQQLHLALAHGSYSHFFGLLSPRWSPMLLAFKSVNQIIPNGYELRGILTSSRQMESSITS